MALLVHARQTRIIVPPNHSVTIRSPLPQIKLLSGKIPKSTSLASIEPEGVRTAEVTMHRLLESAASDQKDKGVEERVDKRQHHAGDKGGTHVSGEVVRGDGYHSQTHQVQHKVRDVASNEDGGEVQDCDGDPTTNCAVSTYPASDDEVVGLDDHAGYGDGRWEDKRHPFHQDIYADDVEIVDVAHLVKDVVNEKETCKRVDHQ